MTKREATYAVELRAAGRTPAACPYDARVFDVHTSYDGHQSNAPRRYCSEPCRRRARNARRRQIDEHRRRYAGVIALRALEASGAIAPLPGVPDLPQIPDLPPQEATP